MRSNRTAANAVPCGRGASQDGQGLQSACDHVGTIAQDLRISSRIRRFVALSSTTSTAHAGKLILPFIGRAAREPARPPQPDRKPERASLAELALRRDSASHQLDQLARDGQSQSCSPVPSGRRAVDLFKRLEDQPELLFGNADSRVADREVQDHFLVRAPRRDRARPSREPRRAR